MNERFVSAVPKAISLDVGWTLIHPCESLWETFAAVGREAGADLSGEDVESLVHGLVSGGRRHALEQFEAGVEYTDSDEEFEAIFVAMGRAVFGLTGVPGDPEELTERFLERFWKRENWRVFPDVPQALTRLRAAGIRVGVLSNAGSQLVEFLGELGVLEHCDFTVVSAIEGTKKPDRRIFERALALAGVYAAEALHVGDMYLEDVAGASRVGVRPLLMDRGKFGMFPNHPEAENDLPGEVQVVRTLDDVLALVGL